MSIQKLNLEIQKLKEDLQEARDQVIVDMEPAGAEVNKLFITDMGAFFGIKI